MAVATAAEVRAVLAEVSKGLSPTEAGKRLKAMDLPPMSASTPDEILRQDTGSIEPGSIGEVAMAAARGDITREQEKAIRAAFRAG